MSFKHVKRDKTASSVQEDVIRQRTAMRRRLPLQIKKKIR